MTTAALPDRLDRLSEAVLREAEARDMMIAVAESCTGGLLASLLTDVEGCSHVFERGFIVYSERAKCELLGVSQALLDQHGAVSEPVARAMAEGALSASAAQVAVAITGFAGPAGEGDEEGLVHIAVAREGHETIHARERFGAIGRLAIRTSAAESALSLLHQAIIA